MTAIGDPTNPPAPASIGHERLPRFAIGERAAATVVPAEVAYERRLHILGIGFRWRRPPCDEQLLAVSQLPDVATTPMTHRFAGTMAALLVEAPAQTATARASGGGLSDVEHGGTVDPGGFELRQQNA